MELSLYLISLMISTCEVHVRMKTNIEQSFDQVSEYWSPKVIGRVNDQYVKIAKVKGEFVWHK